MDEKLDSIIIKNVNNLCAVGDELANKRRYMEAKSKYLEALKLIPEPTFDWDRSTWIYSAIGDVNFHAGEYEKCMRSFINAVQCPNGLGNPFIHLRLGQAFFELGDLQKSADELARAYMGGGKDIFLEDDPKYLVFLESKIKI
ncbi:hypothetical protein CGH41_22165 [Vibrio parahaemolyticus]|uniref:tetratricopeptide repeat protein n=1 Tax=Vibrio parahaemolyticus TaxID=670 RepID=UPI00084B5C37|nr:hypothetical protein [Vibrio parahaemolyticus]EGQ8107505.1 hypothetical protein [Vibrio parahaemolyticus]ODX68109.1 hypothetical protein BBM10_19770 [Vibrio parahaemolyticus]ODX70572.1 hypothetical protein BBM11_16440 [Vibrio parahaemolyticus]TOC21596.1 hypothetical protein CGJ89_22660 [Vibrio parahaemolyticus]TOO22616.1 hypothetical protein CGH41_22165 [Vibrio parahaemolyticus]